VPFDGQLPVQIDGHILEKRRVGEAKETGYIVAPTSLTIHGGANMEELPIAHHPSAKVKSMS
jgi:hypothetical protein